MAAFDFPDTSGQLTDGSFQYDAGGVVYAWNGETWNIVAADSEDFLPIGGGNMLGAVTANVRTIVAGAPGFDLSTGNLWKCAGIDVPNPTNVVVGMTGVIVFSDAPTAFGSNFKFPGGAAIAPTDFPAVVPFYVAGTSEILLGNPIEGIS